MWKDHDTHKWWSGSATMVSKSRSCNLLILYAYPNWLTEQGIATISMAALYPQESVRTKGETPLKDELLQWSFHELLGWWIHTEAELHGVSTCPILRTSNRPTQSSLPPTRDQTRARRTSPSAKRFCKLWEGEIKSKDILSRSAQF